MVTHIFSLVTAALVLTSAAVTVHSTELPIPARTPAAAPPTGAEMSLQRALAQALARNPALAQLQAGAAALDAVPPQAASLPDPNLELNLMALPTDTFELGQEDMTQLQIGVSQEFPFPGKLGLRRSAAQYDAAAELARLEELRLEVTAEVRSVWWRLFYLDRSLEIVARNRELMRQFIEIAETKYKVGRGLQQDVLLAQLELSRLLELELDLNGQRERTRADLNALMDEPGDTPLTLPSELADDALPEALPENELLQYARERRPRLRVERQLTEAARVRLALARKEYYPDFMLGASYGYREDNNTALGNVDRSDLFSVMFRMNVPLYFRTKQSKLVEQHSFELSRRMHAADDALRQVEAAVSRHLADYRRSREQVVLYRTGIIPQARQTVESMLAGYQVNQVDFLNLVRAEISLYNFEIAYWMAHSTAKAALAEIAAATGMETIYE